MRRWAERFACGCNSFSGALANQRRHSPRGLRFPDCGLLGRLTQDVGRSTQQTRKGLRAYRWTREESLEPFCTQLLQGKALGFGLDPLYDDFHTQTIGEGEDGLYDLLAVTILRQRLDK